jgi:hypothetical protein
MFTSFSFVGSMFGERLTGVPGLRFGAKTCAQRQLINNLTS